MEFASALSMDPETDVRKTDPEKAAGRSRRMKEENSRAVPWICDQCKEKLALSKVKVSYLSGNFEVELMKCPSCGSVYIGEELALGKMLEVEKGLEDK